MCGGEKGQDFFLWLGTKKKTQNFWSSYGRSSSSDQTIMGTN
jgi:hypothetical protein